MGEIVNQDEFYAAIKLSDAFDLVALEKDFLAEVKAKLAKAAVYGS